MAQKQAVSKELIHDTLNRDERETNNDIEIFSFGEQVLPDHSNY